jgi:hypothetical protein
MAFGTLVRGFGITATATMRRIFTAFPFHPFISNKKERQPDCDDMLMSDFIARIE